jgi:DNA-binding MarR family transcriptional regulator
MADRPAALSPAQEQAWSLLVGLTMWLPAALDARLAAAADVSHAEYQVLRWLSRTPDGALHMTPLATTASVTQSHLSRIVARLEKRAWVVREPDPADGRYTLARLTDAGAAIVATTDAAYDDAVRELVFDAVQPADVDALRRIATSVLLQIKPECVAAHSEAAAE